MKQPFLLFKGSNMAATVDTITQYSVQVDVDVYWFATYLQSVENGEKVSHEQWFVVDIEDAKQPRET